jgi:hypothetical protein
MIMTEIYVMFILGFIFTFHIFMELYVYNITDELYKELYL